MKVTITCNSRDDQPYIPPTKPYELSSLASDLVLLARYMLKPQGRLVFFLPTVTDEYEELDVQSMLCDGMEIVANSLQNFGSWGRRVRRVPLFYDEPLLPFSLQLITIRKATTEHFAPPSFEQLDNVAHIPAHKDFREKYFQGFKKSDVEQISELSDQG